MSKLFRNTLIGMASLSLATAPALADDHGDDSKPAEMTKGEKKLAKELEGRVAGEPTSCVTTLPHDSLRIIDRTALVYGRGKTIYVNYTRNPETLDDSDVLVIKRTDGSRLCRLDSVTTVDRGSHMFSGVIFLDDFIPYTRVEDADKKGG